MAIALVTGNHQAVENDGAATTLAAPAFTNNITTNNLLIVSVSWASDGALDDATVTNSGTGLTWTRTETGPTYDAGEGVGSTIYYAVIDANGGTKPTITANFWTTTAHSIANSVPYRVIEVSEWSGAATTTPLDKHGSNVQTISPANGTDNSFAPASTVTPMTDGQLIYGLTCNTGNGANSAFLSAGTHFTEIDKVVTTSPANFFYETEYYVQPTAAAVQATWSFAGAGASADVLNLMATFKAAGGGPSPDAPSVSDALTMGEAMTPQMRSFVNVIE